MPQGRSSAERAEFGRYELGTRLASGGMAAVYLARSTGPEGFSRLAAVKLIHEHLTEQRQFVDMFFDEARIASRIQHPDVCQVYDFGESPYGFYIAMEYLEGQSLGAFSARLAESPLADSPDAPLVIAHVLGRAAAGLHAAHEACALDGSPLSIVHRDVSPQNVFLTFSGSVKVIDFGIASAVDRVHRTHTGGVKGKFAYMAPEQAAAKPVDRRADVWALGVLLWELLTRERLFLRESPLQTVMALATDIVPAPSTRGAPPELDGVVMRALSRDIDERYPTARAFAQDLRNAARKLGEPADEGTLEAWMEELFPGQREAQRALARESSWGAAPSPTSGVEPGEISHVARAPSAAADTTPELSLPPPVAPPSARKSWPAWAWYIGAGSLAGALVVLGLLRLFDGGGDAAVAKRSASGPRPAATDVAPAEGAAVAAASEESATAAPTSVEADGPSDPSAARGEDDPRTDTAAAAPGARRARRGRRRAAPGADPAPAAVRDGTVVISMRQGFAYVYDARGRFLGETPLVLRRPAGQLRLSLRPNGQPPPRPIRVQVVAGERVTRSF